MMTSVEDLAHVHRVGTAPALRGRDQRRNQRPFGIGEVARVAQAAPVTGCAMVRVPHGAPPRIRGAEERITTDSSDSSSFRNGTERLVRK
jgi:hypothetical protein